MVAIGSSRGSEIQEFYSGKCVFITGVTGFLGKAVLEKLLRACPHVSNVYILLRAKRGVDVGSRLKSVLQSAIFDVLRQENPTALNKVFGIEGDITLPDLGICRSDRDILSQNVSVVIHSAASVRFNEPLKYALNINYNGARRMLDLCYGMEKLAAFAHISTAYVNCDITNCPEEILAPANVSQIPTPTPKEIEMMSDEEVAAITPMICGEKPNTYTYTKCLAENLLKEQGAQLPICIVRPSIIVGAWKEPQTGFVDSLTGITGLVAATGKGMLTSMVCGADKVSDAIPLDVCSNLILAAAWNTATQRSENIRVYNCCSGSVNPVTHEDFRVQTHETLKVTPFEGVIRYPYLKYVDTHAFNMILNLVYNFLPFFILDSFAVLTGQKPKMLKMFNKIQTTVSSLTYFHTNEWNFPTDNMTKLEHCMSEWDREMFYWNIKDLVWKDFNKNYCLGIKKWIFKEELKDLHKALARTKRLYWIQKSIQFFILIATAALFLRVF